MVARLGVIATAGHVDHGKSSLIVRLTGTDPDRFAEEKRRGLTIDLGYAWTTLPSGREVGFVDVPGHERFIGNMLAGVGPVRLVLFVVAADEGWKPQSEEHLQILDVLGLAGGVIALTKADLVDDETLELAREEIREHVDGTALASAPVIAMSSRTGEGIGDLLAALDAMLVSAPAPDEARTRLFIDRVFTIKGAGTVVTGTLAGGCIAVDDEVEVAPSGERARIRSLQTHKRSEDRACSVSRVAANIVGLERETLRRGDVLVEPGRWRPTDVIEAVLRPVRGLGHPVTGRGAFTLHAGAAEVGAKLRLYGGGSLDPAGRAFVQIRLAHPLTLDVFDHFVLRDAGRRETVAGGTVLDVSPPRRPGPAPADRLAAREHAERADLPALLAEERGAVSLAEAGRLTGAVVPEGLAGAWLIRPGIRARAAEAIAAALTTFHAEHPLEEGADLAVARRTLSTVLRDERAPMEAGLIEFLLGELATDGSILRTASTVRLGTHRVALETHSEDLERLLAAIGGEHEATPPTVQALQGAGLGRDVIEAAARAGMVVRVSPELVFTPEQVARAERVVREAGGEGITVSAFREALGTSRKYALPLLTWFDGKGITRREGDLRFPRDPVS